ncbi:MAG: gliding motility-associated C-terminal domain-containing protein [Bacteroidia bacterium]
MKKLKLVVIFILGIITTVNAQSTFRINYDVALFDLPVNATEALTPDNYVFSGFHSNFIPFVSSLSQIDANGNVVWAKRYSDASLAFMFGDFKRDQALNRYYICGGSDNGPAFLIFVDATGNFISGRRFSISQADGAFFNKVIKTNDGGYLCVGYVIGYDPDGAGPEVKFSAVTNNDASCSQSATEQISSPLIVKFDASGNHQWHRVFRYYVTSNTPANRIYNDASFVDVVEVSDGYIAIGNYKVNNVFSVFNSDCEDTTPTDAMFLKVDNTGAIVWHRQIDNPSNSTSQSSKSLSSISKTAAGLPLISGNDNAGGTTRPCILMRLPGSGAWANPTWIRRVGGGMLIPLVGPYHPLIPNRFFETSDGQYAVWANYLPIPSFSNLLFKINPSNNSFTWARQHTFNLASILPFGEQVSDGGYIGVSYNLAGTGHDLHFIKTDNLGNAPTTCAATSVNLTSDGPSYTYGTPIYNSWNSNTVTNTTITPTVTNITPNRTVQCIQTVCVPPPAPTTVTATPNPVCAGQQVNISASGGGPGNTYNVYSAATGGTYLGTTSTNYFPTTTTTYYVETVSGTDSTCVSTTRTSVTVTVNPTNTVSGPNTATVCVNQPISPAITHTTTGATGIGTPSGLPGWATVSWNSNTITISGTPTASGTFNYTIPLTGGCGTVNATGTITVISNNTVSGPNTATACVNQPISPVITHTTTGATGIGTPSGLPGWATVSWNSNTITISGTPTASGTFNYTIPLTGGCGTVNATGTIIVNPENTVTGNANATVCVNTPLSPNIILTTTGATGIDTPSGLPNGVTATWNANTITISGTPTATGTFNYTIPLIGGCGTVNATGTITVNPENTVTGNANATVCVNTPLSPNITLTTTGATGIGTPSGLPGWATATWNSNTITISGTPTASGTFNYTIPLTGGCGAVNATGTITVNPENTVTGNANATVCVNTPLSPNITLTTTGATGIGTPSGLPGWATATWNSNTITISGTPTATGTFNYTIPLTGGCGTVSATGTITVINVNTVTGPVNASLCVGNPINPAITHTTSGATGIGTPSGLPSGVTATWNANTITLSGTPTTTGTFNYSIPLTGGCGTVSATGTIIVNPSPIPIITGDTVICSGQTAQLTTGNFTSYNWSNGGSTQTITVSPTANTTYYLLVTDANGCIGGDSIDVLVNPLPNVTINGITSICEGQSTTLTATGGGAYLWSTGDNTSSIIINPTVPTSYTVVVTSNNGCVDSASVNVSVFQTPNASITGSQNMCSGKEYTLTANGGSIYSWNTGDTTSTITVNTTIDTTFIVTVSNGVCTDSDTLNVTVLSNPTANAGTDVTINQIQTATLTASGGGTYLWTPSTGLDCDTCATVNAKPTETTTYCVTVTDVNGCVDSACVKVTVDFICGEIFVPTIFSPNDDGLNDTYCVLGNCIKELNFTIYSRWGEIVFSTTDPKICWDGTYKGKLMNTGSFVYIIEATLTDGTTVQEKGNFTLVR